MIGKIVKNDFNLRVSDGRAGLNAHLSWGIPDWRPGVSFVVLSKTPWILLAPDGTVFSACRNLFLVDDFCDEREKS